MLATGCRRCSTCVLESCWWHKQSSTFWTWWKSCTFYGRINFWPFQPKHFWWVLQKSTVTCLHAKFSSSSLLSCRPTMVCYCNHQDQDSPAAPMRAQVWMGRSSTLCNSRCLVTVVIRAQSFLSWPAITSPGATPKKVHIVFMQLHAEEVRHA